jgi:hypothetical protein
MTVYRTAEANQKKAAIPIVPEKMVVSPSRALFHHHMANK